MICWLQDNIEGIHEQPTHLVDDAVPCEAGVVYDDVDLAIAKLSSSLDELLDVSVDHHVDLDANGTASILVDLVGYIFCLFCSIHVSS